MNAKVALVVFGLLFLAVGCGDDEQPPAPQITLEGKWVLKKSVEGAHVDEIDLNTEPFQLLSFEKDMVLITDIATTDQGLSGKHLCGKAVPFKLEKSLEATNGIAGTLVVQFCDGEDKYPVPALKVGELQLEFENPRNNQAKFINHYQPASQQDYDALIQKYVK